MGRRDRRLGVGQDERQVFRIVAMGFNADRRALDCPRAAALGAALHRRVELRQGQIALVIRPGKPFRGDAADPLSARDIDFVAAARVAPAVQGFKVGHGSISATGRPRASLSTSKPVTGTAAGLLLFIGEHVRLDWPGIWRSTAEHLSSPPLTLHPDAEHFSAYYGAAQSLHVQFRTQTPAAFARGKN